MESTTYILVNLLILAALTNLSLTRLVLDKLSTRVVTTNYGRLRGVLINFDDPKLQPVEGYIGVEYASLRGGAFRFMPPRNPGEKWEGVKIANSFRPVCPQKIPDFTQLSEEMPSARIKRLKQISEHTKVQAEDCLFLNIYIPARERKGPAPVLVFIHGESYDFGTGNAYDGSVLASYADIAVVTLNYRLGALGFLSSGDSALSGNYALFDLVAALHWIQNNIADFGGDSSRVTLMGQGYGAVLSNILSMTSITKSMRMFNRIILQSGSALSPWAMAKNPQKTYNELVESAGCDKLASAGSQEVVRCLRNASLSNILQSSVTRKQFVTSFGPVVDGVLLQSIPEKMLLKDNTLFAHLPLMFGVMKYEGSNLLGEQESKQGLTLRKQRRILRKYVTGVYNNQQRQIAGILDHYYKFKDVKNNSMGLKHKMVELLGDGHYNVPALLTGNLHERHGKDTYFYVFGHTIRDTDPHSYQHGEHHGEELPFLFGAPIEKSTSPYRDIDFTKGEKVLSEATMKFYGNFVISGNPNIPLREDKPTEMTADSLRFLDVYWPRYVSNTQQFLQLGTRPLVNHHYRRNRFALWTELIPKKSAKNEKDDTQWDYGDDGSVMDNSSKAVDVRHVIPPPPTPPVMPPFNGNSTLLVDKPKLPNDAAETDDVIVETGTEKIEIVTKIIDVIRYQNVTQLITKSGPLQQETQKEFQLDLTLSVTIGVGSALLFLNIVILIGVYCQRQKIKAERKLLEKSQVQNIDDRPVSTQVTHSVVSETTGKNGSPINILENHLYEKAMEQYEKNSLSKPTKELNETERNTGNYDGSLTSSNNMEGKQMRGIPHGPARAPAVTEEKFSDFEVCKNYNIPNRQPNGVHTERSPVSPRNNVPIPRQRTPDSLNRQMLLDEPGSYYDDHVDSPRRAGFDRSRSPRQSGRRNQRSAIDASHQQYVDDNRARTMTGMTNRPHNSNPMISPNRDNQYFTQPRSPRRPDTNSSRFHSGYRDDESPYKTPRRIYSEDVISSDSGIQHMSYDHHPLSAR